MQYLQSLLDQNQVPLLTALLLGLMTAVSPCPLATNITALAYIGKDMVRRRTVFLNGLYYILGRMITYIGIGSAIYLGASKFHVSRAVQSQGEKWIGPLLLIIGILMLDIIRIPGSSGKWIQNIAEKVKIRSTLGALLLGIVFALAFCPYSGVLYFGMLMPLVLTSREGLMLLPVFSVATALPIIMLAYVIAFSFHRLGRLYNRLKSFEKWLRKVVAVIFILTGFYLMWIYFL